MKKKFLSTILALAMVLSLLPTAALAVEGDTTEVSVNGVLLNAANPYWKNGATVAGGTAEDYNAYFNADTGVLTLRNANIDYNFAEVLGTPDKKQNAIWTQSSNLKIVLEGTNMVTSNAANGAALNTISGGNITISGTGELTAIGKYSGIYSFEDILIESGTIIATGEMAGIMSNKGDLAISGGNVTGTATADGGCGITRDFGNANLGLTVTGDSTVVGIGLNGASAIRTVAANTTHNVYAGTVANDAQPVASPSADTWAKPYVKLAPGKKISGTVTEAAVQRTPGSALAAATVQVMKGGAAFGASAETNEQGEYTTQTLPNGTYSVRISKAGYEPKTAGPLTLNDQNLQQDETLTATSVTTYNVWVGGTQVTDGNKDNVGGIHEGKVSYDPTTSTLTLAGAKFSPAAIGIEFSTDLTIAFSGKNSIACTAHRGISAGESDAKLTIQAVNGAEDSLNVVGYQEGILTKAGNITISSGIVMVSGNIQNGISSEGAVSIHADAIFSAASGSAKAISAQTINQSHAIVAGNDTDGRDAVPVANNGIASAKYVRMEKGYTISGTVTDGAAAVADATVQLKMGGKNYGSVLTTDASGAFTTLKVAAGDYTLTASKTGYEPATSTAITVSAANVTGQALIIPANGQTATVSNVAEWKAALANEAVSTINLTADIVVDGVAAVARDLTVNGGSHTLSATIPGTDDWGKTQAGSDWNIFTVAENKTATIDNLTIKGGAKTAILNSGTLLMNRVVITQSGSATAQGGGLYNVAGAKAILTDCAFTRNVAKFGGGFVNGGTMIMDRCSVTENRNIGGANNGGGGCQNGNTTVGAAAKLYLNNCTFANNQSTEIGGGINNCRNSVLYVLGTTITGNVSTTSSASAYYGGGIGNNSGTVYVVNSILSNNYASAGGGSYVPSDIGKFSGSSVAVESSYVGTTVTTSAGTAFTPPTNLFSDYRSEKLLAADGAEVGSATFARSALVLQTNKTYAAPLNNATATDVNRDGTKVYFTYNEADAVVSVIAHGDAPTYLLGSKGGTEVKQYQDKTIRVAGVRGAAATTGDRYYTVKVKPPVNGTVTGVDVFGKSVKSGDTITLTATPNSGFEVEGWYGADAKIEGADKNKPYSHKVIADITIEARMVNAGNTHVTSVTLNKATLALNPGGIEELIATIAPENATDWDVSWRSSDTSVVTVADATAQEQQNITANVTAVAEGTATITVITNDGKFEDTCVVTVTAPYNPGPGYRYYAIKATAGEDGTISPNGSVSVREKADKTYTIKPNEGYEIAAILVDGVSVGKVSTYTFEKVTAKHTIEAKFVKAWVNPYEDVKTEDEHYDAIRFVTQEELMNGTGGNKFTPNGDISRGMITTILYRLASAPAVAVMAEFEDIVAGAYYIEALNWATENKVALGYGNGKFGPEDITSLEQLITLFWRDNNSPMLADYTGLSVYSDVAEISGWASQAMAWAHQQGLLVGHKGTLNPKGNVSRAEVAAILMLLADLHDAT